MVHQLASKVLLRKGLIDAAGLAVLPVIRSRPDVLLRSSTPDGHSVSRLEQLPLSFAELVEAMRTKELDKTSGDGPVIMGYRGPWIGGWGDIVWAMRFDGVAHVVRNGASADQMSTLLSTPPPPTETLPPFNTRIDRSLRTARTTRSLRAELVWMHVLRQLGVRPFFWRFCNVARLRLAVATGVEGSTRVTSIGEVVAGAARGRADSSRARWMEEVHVPVVGGRLTVRRVHLHTCN